MRAMLCHAFGPIDDISIDEIDPPECDDGEVVIAVAAASVQFVDIRIIEGKSLLNTSKLDAHFGRSVKVTLPLVPGCEAAGTVLRTGTNVTKVAPGDRVLASGLLGAWAEQAVFTEEEVAKVPPDMTMADAAAFYVLYYTAAYALLTRGRLTAADTVLVLGAGSGVGLATVEIAKAAGAKVIAAASSDAKLAAACERGADVLLDYGEGPLDLAAQKALSGAYRNAAGEGGITVVADLVGGDYAEPAMRAMEFKARFLTIGFSAGVPAIPMHVIFNKNAELIGVEPVADGRLPGQNPELLAQLFAWYGEGRLRPHIGATYRLEDAADALRLLQERRAIGRVLIDVSLSEHQGARA
jgi:NADPH2:quinone reductase